MDPSDRPVPIHDVAVREIGGEVFIVDAATSTIHTFNGVGAFVWRRLDGVSSLQQIAQALTGEYDVDLEQAVSDVVQFADELLTKDLVSLPA